MFYYKNIKRIKININKKIGGKVIYYVMSIL